MGALKKFAMVSTKGCTKGKTEIITFFLSQ